MAQSLATLPPDDDLGGLSVDAKLSLIEDGLPFDRFEKFAAQLGFDPGDLLELLGTPRRTRSRRLAGATLSSLETERILRVAQLFSSAVKRSGDRAATLRWISDPERIRRAAFALEMDLLLGELNTFAPPVSIVQSVPQPRLPPGFTVTPWEIDDRPALPNTLPVRCRLTAVADGKEETIYVRLAPGVDSSQESLRKLVYERFVEAIAELRLRTFTCV
jgi:uncharacterized protein (DUF2384 family)